MADERADVWQAIHVAGHALCGCCWNTPVIYGVVRSLLPEEPDAAADRTR